MQWLCAQSGQSQRLFRCDTPNLRLFAGPIVTVAVEIPVLGRYLGMTEVDDVVVEECS